MNIISLRKVGSFEIPDSFRGILRISPNLVNNSEMDDASSLLTNTAEIIPLSDSTGNKLPIDFVPKIYKTIVDSREGQTELINITLQIQKLYVSQSLNIRQTLYLSGINQTPPIIIAKGNNTIGYPIEAPDDIQYFNRNNKYNFSKENTWDENIASIPVNDAIYNDESNWLKINGKYAYTHVKQGGKHYKVPILKRRPYVLGTRVVDKYPISKAAENIHNLNSLDYKPAGNHTQLSFLPLESFIYSNLEADVRGIYRASATGRYLNLNVIGAPTKDNNTGNDLAKQLFGEINDDIEARLNKKTPIIGLPVQSGTIHYNAIPARRYLFHLARRYSKSDRNEYVIDQSQTLTDANLTVGSVMNNITRQYVLCDGKNIATDYPAINKHSFENNWSDTHEAIKNSLGGEGMNFKTPQLFDCDQLSLRYLRGINWLRTANGTVDGIYDASEILNDKGRAENKDVRFMPNNSTYLKFDDGDAANHTKNIWEVGMYRSSTDNKLQRNWKHSHLGFASQTNDEVGINPHSVKDTLKDYSEYFKGRSSSTDYCPVISGNYRPWKEYVTGWSLTTTKKFNGTTILPTIGGLCLKGESPDNYEAIRNYPIARYGGSSSYFLLIGDCLRYGIRHIKCLNHRTRITGEYPVRDGGYAIASYKNFGDGERGWRLITSLPERNKYDIINPETSESTHRIYRESPAGEPQIAKIDDNNSFPSSMNFIPLMKI